MVRNFFRLLPVLLLLLIPSKKIFATHLMGGSMTYLYEGMVGPDHQYRITLRIYRYCDATGGGTAPLDFSMLLGIYDQDPLNPNDDKNWFRTETMGIISQSFITPPSPGINCPFNTTVCVEEGVYEAVVLLPPSSGGFHLLVERCCRNGNIQNLNVPGSIGQTYYCFIPAAPIINSSPQFSDIPVPYICAGDLVTIVNNAVDPDGDSLVYSFEIPYSGYSGAGNAIPDPQFDNNPYGWPIPGIIYSAGYNVNSPFGAGGSASIDPNTGLTSYQIPNQGFYVVVVEIKEYRNGVLIASVRRDLQLIAITCPLNAVPAISNAGGAGQTSFTITEGQTLCFPVAFVDPDGDSLFLTSSGNIFNIANTNPPATLPNVNGSGFVTSQFCWSTECGMAQATPYQFVVSVTDNGCPPKIRNQIYSIKVNPSPIPPAPAVAIQQNPPGPICIGTEVTFTALPTFGGTNPIYQWQLNGVNVGVNSNTFISSSLNDGDIVTVSMTSNSVCVNSNTASSAPVVMAVNPFAAPSVSISVSPAGPVCSGTNVSFTAVPVNPGSAPVYQWTVNGINSGGNSPVFNSTTLAMGSVVGVSLSSDPACPGAASNTINMVVNPVLTPSVTITSNNSGAICPGETVNFQAYPIGGGTLPTFQWQVNGVNAGSNSNTFSSSTLSNGDNVTVILTSSEICVTIPTANSNVISIAVTAPTSPTVSIAANPAGPVCKDDNIIFTATATNGGSAPGYQWQVNGVTVFSGSSIFATSSLSDGDQVRVVLTSSLACLASSNANSNVITVDILPLVTPSVSISVNPGTTICVGTPVTFTANGTNGGTAPVYTWLVNGIATGTSGTTFTTSSLNHLDKVRVVLASNANCVSPPSANSNQITMTVNPVVNPSVTIAVNPAGPVCSGDLLTFTASPVNGGITPSYQWFVNGVATGGSSAVFSSTILSNGDFVRVRLTSSISCVTASVANSNTIPVQISPNIQPDISITVAPSGSVCDGDTLTFTSSWTGAGISPAFVWRVNGISTGIITSDFVSNQLANGDIIDVVLTSSAFCALPVTDTSNTITAIIDPLLAPAALISANPPGTFCDGQIITYNSFVSFGGLNPTLEWLLNGVSLGIASNSVVSSSFLDGDTLQLVMTSSEKCLQYNPAFSNLIIIDRLPPLLPEITAIQSVCEGEEALLFVQVSGGTGGPYYLEWSNGLGNGTSFVLLPYQTTTYTVSVSDSCSTVRSDSATITVHPLPEADFISNPLSGNILTPGYDFIDRSENTNSWFWDFGDGNNSSEQSPFHFYIDAGIYTIWLVATSADGCIDSTFRELSVEDVLTVYVPNSFTPNEDGINDDFGPVGHGFPGYEMSIFNRWGQEVFSFSGGDGKWDGNDSSGNVLPSGVYVYKIRVFNSTSGKPIRGTVTLVR